MFSFCQVYLGYSSIDLTEQHPLFNLILKRRMINKKNFDIIMKIICIDIMQRARRVKSLT